MEASIVERQIRDFIRLLQCAARFGDDLNMHANKDAWELAVTNSTKSAFCLFKLFSSNGPSQKAFFSRYRTLGTKVHQRRGVKCSLLVKSMLSVLGKASSSNNVERLDLKIIDNDQARRAKRGRPEQHVNGPRDTDEYEGSDQEREGGIEATLIMKLVCRHGVTKKHSLHLGPSDFLRAEVDPNSTPSSFGISAKSLRDMLDHFSLAASSVPTGVGNIRNENQLGWMFGKNEVRVKSWEGGGRDLSTEIKVNPEEFEDYWVEQERVDLTLPMKEFRAALTLAEQLGISLTIAFSEATQPLTLTSTEETSEDGFAIFCAIATTTSDAFDPPRCKVQIRSGSSSERKVTRSLSESDGNGPKRQMSEQPKKKTRLDFGGSQRAAVVVNSAPATTSNGGRDLPFFLPSGRWNVAGSPTREAGPSGNQTEDAGPSGSQVEGAGPSWNQTEGAGQRGSQTEGAGPSMSQSDIPFPPKSQRFRMTQQEMLDLSGFQGVRPEDLVDEMDYAEEEEERQGMGIDGSQREGDENRPPVEMSQGESRLFEPDLTILVADERDVPRMERSEEPMQDERARAVDEESGLDDWEELMPLTQASADEREFPSLFDD